jgi:RNA recognition motif-containing protein
MDEADKAHRAESPAPSNPAPLSNASLPTRKPPSIPLSVSTNPFQPTSQPNQTPLSTPLPTNPNRIFIGNLPPTLSEFALLKLFQPFGKITALEYLFHKSGPLMGLPKGYAFVEYEDGEGAVHAIASMHGKKLASKSSNNSNRPGERDKNKPRPLVVSFSVDHSAMGSREGTPVETPSSSSPYGPRSALPRKESRFSSFTSTDRDRDRSSYRGNSNNYRGGNSNYRGGSRGGHGQRTGTPEPRQGVQIQLKSAKLGNASTDDRIEALEKRLRSLED